MNKVYQVVCALVFVALTAYGQSPDKTPPAKATPAAAAPASSPTVPPEKVKELADALRVYQLDQLSIQQAKITFSQTDEVSKRAMQILNDALAASPEVKKANEQAETDRKALVAKVEALRTAQGLDKTWDWDFNQSKFIQTSTPAPGVQAKPAEKK